MIKNKEQQIDKLNKDRLYYTNKINKEKILIEKREQALYDNINHLNNYIKHNMKLSNVHSGDIAGIKDSTTLIFRFKWINDINVLKQIIINIESNDIINLDKEWLKEYKTNIECIDNDLDQLNKLGCIVYQRWA